MAGEFLPPVVTRLEGDIGGLAAKVAEAKALIKSIATDARVDLNVDVNGIGAAVAKVAALKAATAGAGAAAGASIPVWHRWLDLIHFGFAVLGQNLIADAIGIAAFGLSAAANLGPAVEAVNNLGQTYGYLNNQQKAAAETMTQLKNQYMSAVNTGVFATFYGIINLINNVLGRSGTVTRQATTAFEYFAAILQRDFASPQWAEIFGRSSSLVKTDLEALMRLLDAFIQLIPGLLHDFNGMGLAFLNGATLILRGLAYISEADPVLTRFAYAAYLAYRAYKYLWVGMGTGPGPVQALVTSLKSAWTWMGNFATKAREGGTAAALTGTTLGGLSLAAWGAVAGIGALVAGEIILATHTTQSTQLLQMQIQSLQQQDGAVQGNVQGWILFSEQTNTAAQSLYNQSAASANARFGLVGLSLAQHAAADQFAYASQQAAAQAHNLYYLMQVYHLTGAQAYALGAAVGVSMNKAFGPNERQMIANYEQALNASRSPLTAVQYDMQQAANQALQLDDRVTALKNAFDALATPFNNTILDTVTYKQDLATLTQALQQSNNKVGYNTQQQQASAQAMAQAAKQAIQLSQDILQQTGSTSKALGPIQQMINYLTGLHSHSKLVADEISILRQYIDSLKSKDITLGFHFVTSGSPPAIGGYVPPSVGGSPTPNTRRYGNAAGTGYAMPGWSWVGENGPELMHLRGGEQIKSNSASRDALSNGAAASGGGLEIKVYLDGKELRASLATATYNDNFRNGNRISGGRPSGTWRPR